MRRFSSARRFWYSWEIVMLGLYLNTPQPEIEDPMGREPEVYRRVAAQIDEALDNWLRRMDSHDS